LRAAFLFVTAPAANLARVSRVNSFKRPPSVFSFDFRHCKKVSPSHVTNRLREMAIPDHPANVQILDRDRVKAPDQIGRNLMVKILATAPDLHVRFGYFDPLFGAPPRSFLFARQSPLLPLQIRERVLEIARVFDFFPVRECGETGNANIYAYSLSGRWQGFRFWRLADNQSIPAINTACDAKLFALSFDRAGEPDSTASNAWNPELVALDRARSDFLVLLRESVIPVFALESGKPRLLSILNAAKKAIESLVNAFERILLDCPQMAFQFGQRASFSQMARLFCVAERLACYLITRNPFGKSSVIDLARVFKFALACLNKACVNSQLKFEGFDCGIFGFSHRVSRLYCDAHWRDLMKGCNLSSGCFSYTTIGQSVKQRMSEGNVLRMREIVLRSPISIPLRFTAEGGGSFRATLWQLHSEEG
jgi:hypothetical protein